MFRGDDNARSKEEVVIEQTTQLRTISQIAANSLRFGGCRPGTQGALTKKDEFSTLRIPHQAGD